MANQSQSTTSSTPKSAKMPRAPGKVTTFPTVDALIARAQDRTIARESTVRLSPENPEVQRAGRLDEVRKNLNAAGLKLVVDAAVGKSEIRVEPPKT